LGRKKHSGQRKKAYTEAQRKIIRNVSSRAYKSWEEGEMVEMRLEK